MDFQNKTPCLDHKKAKTIKTALSFCTDKMMTLDSQMHCTRHANMLSRVPKIVNQHHVSSRNLGVSD